VDLIATILIGIGLAMDAFAVSVSCGLTLQAPKRPKALKIALAFGSFQALMPVIGWLAGKGLQVFIINWDHWLAFVLLAYIGTRMIFQAVSAKECRDISDPTRFKNLMTLSFATSIDAFAVGITFALLQIGIATPVIIIGLITFAMSLTGTFIGKQIGNRFGKKVEILGGIILIGIGLKILLEHLLG